MKNMREMMQALVDGHKIRDKVWEEGDCCYFDESGNVVRLQGDELYSGYPSFTFYSDFEILEGEKK